MLAAIVPVLGAAAQSSAQVTAGAHDSRWQPWLGCWSPTGAAAIQTVGAESLGPASRTMVCVVPGSTSTAVDIVNFAGGAIVDRTVVDPGRAIAKSIEDCSGTETATWSADGRRLLMRGTFTCARGVKRVESGIMAIDPEGQWVQSQSVSVNGNASTFVARFRDTGIAMEGIVDGAIIERPLLDANGLRLSPPRDGCVGTQTVSPINDERRVTVKSDYQCAGGLRRVADATFTRSPDGRWMREGGAVPFGTPSARADAGAPVTTDDVLEVAKAVDPVVTEAWLSDRQARFPLTGKELARLADNGMPTRVLDVMVAISNPKSFTLRRPGSEQVGVEEIGRDDLRGGADRVDGRCLSTMNSCYGMLGMGWLYGADRYYGFDPYGFGFNQFGYGSRFGYGYGNGFGFGGGGWGPGFFYGNGPVVVVSPNTPQQPRGRLVYGQGYTRDRGASSSGADTFRASGSGGSSGASSGGSSSGGGSAGGSSSGASSGGGGRTAKPRGGG